MRNFLIYKRILPAAAIIVILIQGLAFGEKPAIDVIYPKKDATIGAVDSTFILGSVTPGSDLYINRQKIIVHDDGGFIGFLPLHPGDFSFDLTAVNSGDTSTVIWPVYVPEPKIPLDFDSLQIMDLGGSSGNLSLTAGDRLVVEFQGTPFCQAWFSIPGYSDSVPMAESQPQIQPFWGEAVFGIGAVPDSLKIKGMYQGFLDIDYAKLPDSTRLCYFLRAPTENELIDILLETPSIQLYYDFLKLLKLDGLILEDSSEYFVSINSGYYPRLVEFTDSVQIMRVGPRRGYLSIFQPKGVRAMAIGHEGDWIKLRLSQTQTGWVQKGSIRFMEAGLTATPSFVKSVRSYSYPDRIEIEIPLSDKHPFRFEEECRCAASLYIYGADSDTDWLRYDSEETNLDMMTWSQPEPGQYHLKFYFKAPVWGYDVFYDGNILKCQFKNAPQDIGRLSNKKIIIDPGHSPDPGAIGPTGLKESTANLNIALKLEKELKRKGAMVIMTRADDSPLSLYDRPQIAKINDADLFISIHNNALPDGINPFDNNGVSTYYYHLHSLDLAKSIQYELAGESGMNDYGFYYGNLAVNRPTQYPAVLVECAFIILPEHEALLKSEKFQKKIAQSIRKGIERFLREYDE